MDMLILPELPWMDDGAWAPAVDYRLSEVPVLGIVSRITYFDVLASTLIDGERARL